MASQRDSISTQEIMDTLKRLTRYYSGRAKVAMWAVREGVMPCDVSVHLTSALQ